MAVIETSDLTKVYGSIVPGRNHIAVDRLTMEVPSGRIFGFLGPNGAGKTSTLKLFLGLSEPTSGEGTILGQPLGAPAVRQRIGYLAENPSFYEYLRATEFLDYCGKFFDIGRRERRRRVDQLLDYVGLAEQGSEKLKSFSKGMLQRVGLAQALINDPDLLLLDEPMSGLDPLGRKQFKDLIRRACRDDGKSVFFCSHVLAEVEEVCDQVAILSNGRLLTQGNIESLLYLQEVVFTLKGVSDDLMKKLRGAGCAIDVDGDRCRVTVAGEDKADEMREMIDGAQVSCLNTQVKTETLEEFFVRSVTESQEGGADA